MEILLNLRPDSLYQLRTALYAADGKILATTARLERWQYEPTNQRLRLSGSQGSSLEYHLVGKELLEFAGRKDAGGAMARHALGRQEYLAPFADTVRLQGMYLETGRAGNLQECLGGGIYPISDAGHRDLLSTAYRKVARNPGEAVLVALQGRLVEREGGGAEIEVVEVERFRPQQECGGQTRSRVVGTQWQLRQLNGAAITTKGGQQPPFFLLEPEGQRLQAFSGCNRIEGTYRLEGTSLAFKRTVTTRMACPGGNELENRFLAMLDATATFKITGTSLQLFDQAAQPMALCVAVE